MRRLLLMLGVCSTGIIISGCDGGKAPSPNSTPSSSRPRGANALDDKARVNADDVNQNSSQSEEVAQPEEDEIHVSDVDAGPELNGPLFEASYGLAVVADMFGGINVCKGEVSLVVNKDFSFALPNPKISCAGGLCELNMDAVLKMVQTGGNGQLKDIVQGVTSDKKFLSVGQIGNYQFNPPRPMMLLSPFHFDPIEEAISVDESYQGSVRDIKTGAAGSGSLRLKVEEANQERVRWTMTSTGWDGVAKPMAGILTRMDMTWSLNPIGVPHIGAFTVIGDLLAAQKQAGQSMGPKDLAQLCSGSTGQVLGGLASILPDGGGGGLFGGFMNTLVELGAKLVEDVMVGVTLDLKSQKILGKVQERDQ